MSIKLHRVSGVSLIEMMLVITILAILSMAYVGYSRQQTESIKINRTIEQLETFASASRAYLETKQTAWPDSLSDLTPYLPQKTSQTHWQNPYGYEFTIPTYQDTGPYYVATTVPDVTTAKRITGRLPWASYSPYKQSDKVMVKLYLTKPTKLTWQGVGIGAMITEMKTLQISTAQDVTVPPHQCPKGYLSKWAAGIESFSKAQHEGYGEFVSGLTLCTSDSSYHACPTDKRPIFPNQLRLRMKGWTGISDANANVLLIQYCQPIGERG